MKQHILLFCPGFAANEEDSVNIPPLQLFIRHLAQSKQYEVTILSLHYPERRDLQKWNKISHYSVFESGLFSKWRTRWTAWKTLKMIHEKQPISLIHSFWLNDAAWIGERFSKKNNIPHLVTLMGQDARKSNRYLRLFSLEKMNLVGLSSFHAKTFKENTGIEISKIIPWGTAPIKADLTKERFIDILGVGNLIALKNYGFFLEVVAKLKVDFPSIQAQIIGDGKERDELENQIEELDLKDNVQLLGQQPRDFVLEKMQSAKVFFHPSEYESYGYVFAEALQNGMSIVSRKVGCAEASKRWFLGDNQTSFVKALKFLMKKELEVSTLILDPIDEVLTTYIKCYKELL